MNDANDISTAVGDLRQGAARDAAALRLMQKYAGEAQPTAASQNGPSPSVVERVSIDPKSGDTVRWAEKTDQSIIGKVASDVGRGIIETPRNIVGGVRDAVQASIYEPINSLANWLEEQIPLGGFEIDGDGIRYVEKVSSPDFGLPEVKKPDSTTGAVVRGLSQWMTGFFGPGKFATKGWAPTTKAGAAGKAAVQGAVADFAAFEEHEKRLSDLIQEFPELQNPISEYLASNPDDGFAEGRFKNAMEGLGLGVVTEGVVHGLKAIRSSRLASARTDPTATAVTAPARPQISEDAFSILGDETAPAIATRPRDAGSISLPTSSDLDLAEQTTRGITQTVEPETYINFARIDAPEDVQNVMQQMADAFKGYVDAARRGEKMTFAQMELNAQQEDAFKALAERRQGQPLNAEQSLAARQLWATSGEKLTEIAKVAADNPNEANLFAFRKMLATHYAIQNEVIAARTETARALASWRIPAGSSAERFAEIQNVLREHGDWSGARMSGAKISDSFREGQTLSRQMAERIAALGEAGMIKELDNVVRGSVWTRSRDAFLEVWVNGLLSSPPTHMVNMMSNTGVIFQQMYERGAAAQMSRAFGTDGGVAVGEATAQLFGMVSGLKDALRYSAKSFLSNETGYGMGKIDLPRARAISSEAWGQAKDSTLGRTLDTLGVAVSLPGRALGAEDEFFKTLGYRMELNALALRRATQEVNAGIIQPDQLKSRIADIVADPPVDIKLDAIDQATYQTFTNAPGELTKAISRGVNSIPFPGRLVLPFIRTPANILKYTFERTPVAPLMQHVRADIAAGGARRDIALARVATGSALLAASADLAMSDMITGKGPSDRRERQALERTGWQPYSVKVGDRYFAYDRTDPIGTSLGLAADLVEILSNMDDEDALSDSEVESVQAAIAMSIANNVMNKTYLTGVSDIITAMSDPDRYGKGYFGRFAGSVIPAAVANVARSIDPYAREANTMLERIRSRVPGLSDGLPLRRDMWGEPISYRSGLGAIYDAASPIYSRREQPSPIDEEMLRLSETVDNAFVQMPSRNVSFDGVRINLDRYPGAYSRFVELAGNATTDPRYGVPMPGLGAKGYLDEMVSGEGASSVTYRLLSDEGKADMIKNVVSKYRASARRQLLEEYPEIAEAIKDKREAARQAQLKALSVQ
ncbi:hypothetical protein AB6N01_20480 [Alcaligenes nematophilus]|uniref:hypothetical protein n=1 Tax=Alcaligenes nematophilus TaxID=2994643 RepID=UPI0034E06640